MKTRFLFSASLRLCGLVLLTAIAVAAQTVPAPKDVLGWTPGDDRKLASWAHVIEYFKRLDAASDRVQFEEIGKSTMGAPFVYATISSPENLKNLEKYKQINAKLADPRTFKSNNAIAKQLIAMGKTIVLITCGVHSTEVGSYLSSMLIAYRLALSNEPEIQNILENTIVILVPALNPDGVDIVNNWYQKTLGTPYEGTDPPELYHKYVGHDDNRDWYAFTQVETQLTVDKIHNVWHPQIVHDIHQQGANGSRLFLPPYMQPVEPNVPKQIVEGYTELGRYMAADLRKQGFQGITTDSTYDAWTPARAYSHYHGGVRILSETASCKLATPITVKFEDLRPGEHYDPRKEAPNFGPVWKGGEWHIGDITNYMTTAAFSLLHNAADNREKWLSRFYAIEKEAVRPRKSGELFAYAIRPAGYEAAAVSILERAGIEVEKKRILNGAANGDIGDNVSLIRMDQPYAAFAKALLERQKYPDLKDENGNPIPPYDVTAHTISLLFNLDVIKINEPISYSRINATGGISAIGLAPLRTIKIGIFRSEMPAIDEGWTRWFFESSNSWFRGSDTSRFVRQSVSNSLVRGANLLEPDPDAPPPPPTRAGQKPAPPDLRPAYQSIIFPDQAPNQILNGYAKGAMPDEYTGGVGKEGVENLRKFVEAGGTLVFLNRSSDFAIEQFNLPIKDVTKGLARKDFYIPGSILRTELDTTSPIAKGMPKESIAWFEGGPVFDVDPAALGQTGGNATVTERAPSEPGQPFGTSRGTLPSGRVSARVIARYPSDPSKILLSGWALGAEKIAGKAALVEVRMGKGKIILFGFRPQYRGQSLATFPLLFNAISQ